MLLDLAKRFLDSVEALRHLAKLLLARACGCSGRRAGIKIGEYAVPGNGEVDSECCQRLYANSRAFGQQGEQDMVVIDLLVTKCIRFLQAQFKHLLGP